VVFVPSACGRLSAPTIVRGPDPISLSRISREVGPPLCGLTLFPQIRGAPRASDCCAVWAISSGPRVNPGPPWLTAHCAWDQLFSSPPRHFDASPRLPEAANAAGTWRQQPHAPSRASAPFTPPPKQQDVGAPTFRVPMVRSHVHPRRRWRRDYLSARLTCVISAPAPSRG
jgi:hypothetical protein